MSAPGYTTPLRADTFKNLQLNAGILLKNCTYSSISTTAALKSAIDLAVQGSTSAFGTIVGATRGGGSFTVSRELRQPEVDGRRYGFKGDTFVDSIDAQLSTTLVEITPENLLMAFGTATSSTSGNIEVLKVGTAIDTNDYLTNICWIGDIADGRYVLICLKNALNEADISLTWTDKGEGTLPVEFHAKQASVSDYDTAPFEIVYFTPAT
jgi:hypothetical protein